MNKLQELEDLLLDYQYVDGDRIVLLRLDTGRGSCDRHRSTRTFDECPP